MVSQITVPFLRTAPWIEGRWLREPLLHFLVIGLALYVAAVHFPPPKRVSPEHVIEVTPAEVNRLKSVWASQWSRQPDAKQLKNLVSDYVREEVLYREAIAAGLDRDDSIIRRRLVQKMQFLMQEPSLIREPDDVELQSWFRARAARYAAPGRISFAHVYFSRELRNRSAERDAMGALRILTARGTKPEDVGDEGDAFISGYDFQSMNEVEIEKQFGGQFRSVLAQSRERTWLGPLSSPFGFHLVWIRSRQSDSLPSFEAVRGRVLADYMNERLQDVEQSGYATLLKRYEVRLP